MGSNIINYTLMIMGLPMGSDILNYTLVIMGLPMGSNIINYTLMVTGLSMGSNIISSVSIYLDQKWKHFINKIKFLNRIMET